jgi:replicative DNA helicase
MVPPHDEAAEKAVLGALLMDPSRIVEVLEVVKPEDFHVRRNQMVFDLFMRLSERNVAVDIMTVGAGLKAEGTLGDIGGHAYLAELAGTVTTSAHMMHHAELVAQTAMLRRLIAISTEVVGTAHQTLPDADSVRELLDDAEHRIFAITQGRERGGAVGIGDVLAEAFKKIDAQSGRGELTGLSSGYYKLDDMLGGFNHGEMTIIAARPSMGKTAFVLNLIERASLHKPEHLDHDPVVLFFSLEMGKLSIVQRMLCSRARVDAHRMRTGRIDPSSYADLTQAAGELAGGKVLIDDTPGLSIMAIRSRARRAKHKHGLDMIVIDYLQLMTAKAESRQQEISIISRQLKELARELEVPVLALSQLSRQVENRESKRPQLSDLRESGSIEQDADVVLMLHREEYYNPTEENQGKATVIVAKQRNGPTGEVELQFRGSILRFENPEPSVAETILS